MDLTLTDAESLVNIIHVQYALATDHWIKLSEAEQLTGDYTPTLKEHLKAVASWAPRIVEKIREDQEKEGK